MAFTPHPPPSTQHDPAKPGLSVFVYGTLKPGGRYYRELCAHHAPAAVPAWVAGRLYHLPDFGYPAVGDGEDRVSGYILSFADERVLPELDALEVYDPAAPPEANMYLRVWQTVETADGPVEAWVYRMTEARLAQYRGIYEPSGDWDHLIDRD